MTLTALKSENGIWNIPELEHWSYTYERMLENIKEGIPFKFARYGDGEIYCMNGKNGANCDNHKYFMDLGEALRQSVREEPMYMVGIQPLSVSHIPDKVSNYFGHFKRLYNADVLHNASIDGRLNEFMSALQGRYVILVGPAHLASLFPENVHIVLPEIDCWKEYDHVRDQLVFHLDGLHNGVVLLAASMMSEVIINWFEDFHHTFVDVGSVFDPYCGVKSRKYHHKLDVG